MDIKAINIKDLLEQAAQEAMKNNESDILDDPLKAATIAARLIETRESLLQEHNFQPKDLVQWKPGLKNRGKSLPYKCPFVVMKVLPNPITLNVNESAGNPYFREPLDIIIGAFDSDGDFIELHLDSRRLEPFINKEFENLRNEINHQPADNTATPPKRSATMALTLTTIEEKTHVAEVVHHGEQLTIPEGMQIEDAIELLERRKDYLGEPVEINRIYNAFPQDGANALSECLAIRFGWAAAEKIPGGFFQPDKKPQIIHTEIAPGVTKEIVWGRFSLPNVPGYIECGINRKKGRLCFALEAVVERKNEQTIRAIFDDVERYLKANSIYQGKAIKIRFRDDDGDKIKWPEPEFLDTKETDRQQLMFNRPIQDAIESNLFTPIERVTDCTNNDIPIKRGVLLGGPYGVGKTLAATIAAKLATNNGVTFLYISRCNELADAIEFAKQYQQTACVIFCEDIDRTMSGERSVTMDDVLNLLDGIDTKTCRIITVLTTNHLMNINQAMLRPGRLDAIINITPPDAETAERLIRHYAGGLVAAETNLQDVGQILAGSIPAVIAETVKRAKLVQIKTLPEGATIKQLTADALLVAAHTMREQIQLLADRDTGEPTESEQVANTFSVLMRNAMNGERELLQNINEKTEFVCNYLKN